MFYKDYKEKVRLELAKDSQFWQNLDKALEELESTITEQCPDRTERASFRDE